MLFQVLEYTGRGKSIIDVGFAQARSPLNTTVHYFEIEIVDPGESCYIAIGLTRRVSTDGLGLIHLSQSLKLRMDASYCR